MGIDTPIASDNGSLHDDNVSVAEVPAVGEFVPRQAARRLVLVPHQDEGGIPRSAQDSDMDEMSVPGAGSDNGSVVSGVKEPPRVQEVLDLEDIQAIPVGFRAALQSMDDVDLNRIFQRRANVMKSVPQVVKGPFRNAMKIVFEEIVTGHERDVSRQERAWKAFLLLPRLLLHRKSGEIRGIPYGPLGSSFGNQCGVG